METPQPHSQDYTGTEQEVAWTINFRTLLLVAKVFVTGLANCGGVLVHFIEQPAGGRRTLSHYTTQNETGQRDTQKWHGEASYVVDPRSVCTPLKSNKEDLHHMHFVMSC